MGWGIILSNALSYGTGLTGSFFLNRLWTFSDSEQRSTKRVWLSLTLGYIGLMINTAMVWGLAFIMPVMLGKLIAVSVVIIYNYQVNKHIVFGVKS